MSLQELEDVTYAVKEQRRKLINVKTQEQKSKKELKIIKANLKEYQTRYQSIIRTSKQRIEEHESRSLSKIKDEQQKLKIKDNGLKKREKAFDSDKKKLEKKAVKLSEDMKSVKSREHKVAFDIRDSESELKESLRVRDHIEKEKQRIDAIKEYALNDRQKAKDLFSEATQKSLETNDRFLVWEAGLKAQESKNKIAEEKLTRDFSLLQSREQSVKAAIQEYKLNL